MYPPNPSNLAALLVEKYGKEACSQAIVSLIERQQSGDKAGEKLYLQAVMILRQLPQQLVLQLGQRPEYLPPVDPHPVIPDLDLPELVEDPPRGVPLPPAVPRPTLH